MVGPMQKKQNNKSTVRTVFAFAATVLFTGSVLPVMAAGTSSTTAAQEVHVYTVSSSDSDPLGTLKSQMISQLSTDSIDLYTDDTFNPTSYISYIHDETGTLPVLRESNNVDTSQTGTYTATYTVTDMEGITTKKTLTVNVTGPSPEAIAAQEQAEAEAAAKAAQEAEEAAQAAAQAVITSTAAGNTVYGTSGANPYSGGWSNCTYGAWEAVYENLGISMPSFGNASSWLASAQAYGYATGGTPRAGSVAVYNGHVAYVQSVSADGSSCYIIEGGYSGHYNERWISSTGTGSLSLIGYIYF